MLRIRKNSKKFDSISWVLYNLGISSMYTVLFSSYVLCIAFRYSSNALYAMRNANILRIAAIISEPVPM